MRFLPILLAASLLALASCGGGSSSQPPPPPPPPPVTAACVPANYTGTPDLILLAGNMGPFGYSVDAPAPYALFDSPMGLASDGQGGVYITDIDSQNIRRLRNGVVTTVAGRANLQGGVSPSGDYKDGTGQEAGFQNPRNAVVGPDGNLFVSDAWAGTIRKVTPAGVVTTFAGRVDEHTQVDGPLATARFENPDALAADADGNIYVADAGTVRVIGRDGQVRTLAGAPGERVVRDGPVATARFGTVAGIAVTASGALFVTDTNTVRRLADGKVTTLAGVPNDLTRYANGTGAEARFYFASGIVADPDGTLYVAQFGAIRRVTPEGVVSTLAGGPETGYADGTGAAAQFTGLSGLVPDGTGALLVADTQNRMIRRVTKAGEVATVAGVARVVGHADGTGAAASFDNPTGIFAECSGQFLVADGNVRRVTGTGAVTTVTDISADHVVTGLDGRVVANGYVGGDVNIPALLKTSASGTTILAYWAPGRMAYDGQGNLYFISGTQVKKLTPDGQVTVLAGSDQSMSFRPTHADGTGESAAFAGLAGLAVDKAGNVFVSESRVWWKPEFFPAANLRKITPAGVVTTVAGAFGQPGNVDGTASTARFSNPQGLAFDDRGNLYIADTGNNAIRKMAPDGTVSTVVARYATFVPGPLSQASVLAPRWIAINGNTMAITAQQGVLLLRGLH
ncbi:hypothetical protein E4L96_08210 [Massilia arenosa]|uniref:Gluconolaconase n=1 Tax=Zemynaea arenosa TaxID=2561931 RepID=A0A4Y9SKY9_9BURK|nr:hypothetical protein [Massilia arenosa]TFW22253.1 hypothetical protein E4L96_08210 [Massilia arenosa]